MRIKAHVIESNHWHACVHIFYAFNKNTIYQLSFKYLYRFFDYVYEPDIYLYF